MTVRKWKCIAFAIFAMSSFDRMLWTSADFDKLTTPNQCNEREEGWENKRETRELLQFWIHWKQLWHWYWNIAGINTIYLSIFTLIYSPSIQYNEIIEGLSPRRNIRFNPGLLMVSKRDGRGKEKIFSMTFNGRKQRKFGTTSCTDCTHSYPGCTFSLKSLTDRWSVTLTCPSPLSNPPFIIIQVFCELAIRLSCL